MNTFHVDRIDQPLCSVDFTYSTYIARRPCQPLLSFLPAEGALLPYRTQSVPFLSLRWGLSTRCHLKVADRAARFFCHDDHPVATAGAVHLQGRMILSPRNFSPETYQ